MDKAEKVRQLSRAAAGAAVYTMRIKPRGGLDTLIHDAVAKAERIQPDGADFMQKELALIEAAYMLGAGDALVNMAEDPNALNDAIDEALEETQGFQMDMPEEEAPEMVHTQVFMPWEQ